MFPRRCKSCKCYVAPQLRKCPRCGKVAPELKPKQTKEDKSEARARRDEKVKVILGKTIHWVPSKFCLEAHANMVEELRRQIDKAESARMRNVLRSHLREVRRTLARAEVPEGKRPWTSEIYHTKQRCVSVFISPKGRRYVSAGRDAPADLIIQNPKRRKYVGMPVCRLQLFDKSPVARMKKAEKQEEETHKKRKKAKKEKRAKKRVADNNADGHYTDHPA